MRSYGFKGGSATSCTAAGEEPPPLTTSALELSAALGVPPAPWHVLPHTTTSAKAAEASGPMLNASVSEHVVVTSVVGGAEAATASAGSHQTAANGTHPNSRTASTLAMGLPTTATPPPHQQTSQSTG